MYFNQTSLFSQAYVPFKKKHSKELRKQESARLQEKYPDRIRIICEKHVNTKNDNIPLIDKSRYLVPQELTMSQFTYVIRKRLKLPPEVSIFIMVNGKILPSSDMMLTVFNKYGDEDGFLYMTYNSENVFG